MASNGSSAADVDRSSETILMSDVLCPACKQLLHRPVVLNCGHGNVWTDMFVFFYPFLVLIG